MAEERLKLAVFIDFDNIQSGVKDTLAKDFDVSVAPGQPAALLRGPPGWLLRAFQPLPGLHVAIASRPCVPEATTDTSLLKSNQG